MNRLQLAIEQIVFARNYTIGLLMLYAGQIGLLRRQLGYAPLW